MNAKNNNKNGMNVIENVENEVQVTEESRKAYGRPSVNEAKGIYPFCEVFLHPFTADILLV